MSEQIGITPESFWAFSGTTLGNFRKNAYLDETNSVVYDKRRNSQHLFASTYFDTELQVAVNVAAMRAVEYFDLPIIIAGDLDIQYKRDRRLPKGVVFPVSQLWVPRAELSREQIEDKLLRRRTGTARDRSREVFIAVNPESFLL